MQVQQDVLAELIDAAQTAAVSVAALTEEPVTPFLLGMTMDMEPVHVELEDPNDVTKLVTQIRQEFGRLLAAVFVAECSTVNTQREPWTSEDAIVIAGIALGSDPVGAVYIVNRSAPRSTRDRVYPGHIEGLDQLTSWMEALTV